MNTWRILQGSKIPSCPRSLFFPLVLLTAFTPAVAVVHAQTRFPGPAARENNRSMDEYDRTIDRMKNDAKRVNERRLNLFPQINEDFQRIQVIHNEIVRLLQAEKGLNYDRLADLTDDMKKRGGRLRANLALPEPEKTEAEPTQSEAVDDTHIKRDIVELHDLVVSFVASPIFKNLGVVDATVIYKASENLDKIIDVSDEIKREVKTLSKPGKK